MKDIAVKIQKIKTSWDKDKSFEKKLEKINQLLREFPNEGELFFLAGVCYQNIKDLNKALESYNLSEKNGYKKNPLWYYRGQVLLYLCRFREAFSDLKRVTKTSEFYDDAMRLIDVLKDVVKN